ncbi:YcjX family protein [Vibrio lentus]|nr:YcjX family protein [Vibrio lentus]
MAAWAAFEHIDMSCMSIASIQATGAGYISSGSRRVPALQGVTLNNEPQTMYPGEVPRKLPNKRYWETNQFDFLTFRPMEQHSDRPCQHLRSRQGFRVSHWRQVGEIIEAD